MWARLQTSHRCTTCFSPTQSPAQNTDSSPKTQGYISSLMPAAGPEDNGCSCEIPNTQHSKGHRRSGPGSAEGQAGGFPPPQGRRTGKNQHQMLHAQYKAEAKLQEALLGQNAPCQEPKQRGREGQEASTWGWGGTGPLRAELDGPLRPCFRSRRDQLWQLLQVLNGICNLPRISTVSLFLGPLLFPQFTRRQRKITVTPPSPSRPYSAAF